jgi:L-2-hydroxyglutarate oxidase LhgO
MVASREFLKLVGHNANTSFSKRAFLKEIQTLYPDVAMDDLLPYRSGIRAQMVDRNGKLLDDLIVDFSLENATHILNAVSPALTSSLAFAEHIVSDDRFQKS